MPELLIGCGNSRAKRVATNGKTEWTKLVTMDIDPHCGANVLHSIDHTPWPFPRESFDEIHAYDVLEHVGAQGDFRAFFRHFGEMDRLLKTGGTVHGITPHWQSKWVWSDPGHTRLISLESLQYLDQSRYSEVGTTAMTDYRWLWKGDLRLVWAQVQGDSALWVLQKYAATV